MLDLPHDGVAPDMLADVRPLLGVVGLDKARQEINSTIMPDPVGRYIVALGRRTRELESVMLGASSRAIMHLASAAKAMARLNGRQAVAVQDVHEVAPYVLRHRLIVRPGTTREEAFREALDSVPVTADLATLYQPA
jgi:MoxR-like ATPase